MDTTLERILALIPKKPDGKFVHGALKTFANSIGLKSGNLISDWINGRSESYRGYLYEIAAKYDVSVEWLMGDTDDMGGTGKLREKKPAVWAGVAGGIAGAVLSPGAAAIAAIDTAGVALFSGKKKEPALSEDELDAEIIQRLAQLTPQELALVDAYVQGLLAKREVPPSPNK